MGAFLSALGRVGRGAATAGKKRLQKKYMGRPSGAADSGGGGVVSQTIREMRSRKKGRASKERGD